MSNQQSLPAMQTPLTSFWQCHVSILRVLAALGEVPALSKAALRAQEVAKAAVDLFDTAVGEHHADEERELFPAVLRSATRGEEAMRVQAIAKRLTAEHRRIEGLWRQIRHEVKLVAAGNSVPVDDYAVTQLMEAYLEHAHFEESVYLPLAQRILARDGKHMEALGMSLHMRHVDVPVAA